jgi:hypothetical protein
VNEREGERGRGERGREREWERERGERGRKERRKEGGLWELEYKGDKMRGRLHIMEGL